jgi:3'-phosphoadenosine 5'-phosphosulfate (PAPS) 3'-phosphatase
MRWADRLTAALRAVGGASAALLQLRGDIVGQEADGGQLKTSTDLAAEGWVLGFLRAAYSNESFLAEEEFEQAGVPWPGRPTYWTVDALDGTRSYVDGYPGFCVQVAFVEDGEPRIGVIAEPVSGAFYVAAAGAGAWKLTPDGTTRLGGSALSSLAHGTRFVDSTIPTGAVGAIFQRASGTFVECGSVGLKICRVVEDAADIYAKAFRYKLWDVAPGEVLVREVGAKLGTWAGQSIDYAGTRTHFENILVARTALYEALVASGSFSEYL